jgi:predicted site-specific integrase-resolvase
LNNYKGHDFIFHDIGSGLNTHRSGLRKLCKLVEKRRVAKVVLTYHDRLTRFGFDYLDAYFKSHGTDIIVMNKKADISMQEELVQDLISIITSFCRHHFNG